MSGPPALPFTAAVPFAALAIASWLPACAGPSKAPPGDRSTAEPSTRLVLDKPEVFDLRIPEDFFHRDGRALPESPDVRSCHMQGIAIAGDQLVASCILFDGSKPEAKTTLGKSFVLRAPLCQITGCGGTPADAVDWVIEDITETVPPDHSRRITGNQLGDRPPTEAELARVHLLSHPSGLAYDARRQGVWLANSTYTADSYAHIHLLDPGDLKLANGRRPPVAVPDHIGALVPIGDRYVLGWAWNSGRVIVVDLTGEQPPSVRDNPALGTDDHVDFQDCIQFEGSRVLCSGVHKYYERPDAPGVRVKKSELGPDETASAVRVREGRIQILDVDAASFPEVGVRVVATVKARFQEDQAPTEVLGIRKYRYDQSGAKQQLSVNDYAGYQLPKPLSYEGMSFDGERTHLYFLPEDLPQGRLIRMRVNR